MPRASRKTRRQQRAITERKRRARTVASPTIDYRDFFEHSPDAVNAVDLRTGNFSWANPSAVTLFGAKDENEYIRNSPWTYSPERQPDGRESAEKVREQIATVMRCGSLFFEWMHKRIDGTEFLSEVALTRAGVGDDTQIFAIIRDITERKQLEKSLRQSQERLELATDSARIGIWDRDLTKNKVTWDARVFELYGVRKEDGIEPQAVWEARLHPDDRPRAFAALQAAIDGAGDFHMELRAVWPNGEVHEIEAHALVQRTPGGSPTRIVGASWDITDRKQAEEQIRNVARSDLLTGLPNRRVFVEALEQAIARARRSAGSFAVLYLDLDHFKDVNDTLGHPVGDLLLQAVADRLRGSIRADDTIARFGGDEFAILLTDIKEPLNAAIAAGRIQDAVGETIAVQQAAAAAGEVAGKIVGAVREPFSLQGNEVHTAASVGIAVYGLDSSDAETMLSHADVALYRVKTEARGTYQFFNASMDAEVRARVALGAELREAIAAEQLFLTYQPQVELETGRIVGLEALVRWQHPARGILGAGHFIPEAERSGQIVPLGGWVVREACRQMREWLDAGLPLPTLSVNLSGVQFKRPLELEQMLAAAVAEFGIPERSLELELTESVLMEASSRHGELLRRFRESGYRIAIDDFGSGYSSLDYLRRFPVDRIKIAQTFIADIGQGLGDDAIVRAALGLARELGIEVVVEGAETAAQVELLQSWGCRIVQGFYFARPLPAPELTPLLRIGMLAPALAGAAT